MCVRAGYPLHRKIILLGMDGQQTHEVQGVRMIGACRERLLTAELRVQISTRLHLA